MVSSFVFVLVLLSLCCCSDSLQHSNATSILNPRSQPVKGWGESLEGEMDE